MQSEKHWVVKKSFNVILVVSNIANTSVEYFTHLEDSSGSGVFCPKIFGNFWDCIDADPVKIVLGYDVFNPIFEVLTGISIVLI